MSSPSRRTLLRWIGVLTPLFGAVAAWNTTGESAGILPEMADGAHRQAALGLGGWLDRQGITHAALDQIEGGTQMTSDIRASFDKDPLINVDGFLLPVGFCRYCLTLHRSDMMNSGSIGEAGGA